jgi:ribosome maturation factor RimP
VPTILLWYSNSMIGHLKARVLGYIEQPIADEGYEIAELVLSQYRHKFTLRLYLYSRGGVKLDECARLSRLVGEIFDGTDLFADGYTLEISSLGLDRPLTTQKDFEYRIGEEVRVEFVDRKRKHETGRIVSVDDSRVTLNNGKSDVIIELADIVRAKIIF